MPKKYWDKVFCANKLIDGDIPHYSMENTMKRELEKMLLTKEESSFSSHTNRLRHILGLISDGKSKKLEEKSFGFEFCLLPNYAQKTIIQLLNDEKDVKSIKAIAKAVMKVGADKEGDVYEGITDSNFYKEMFGEMFASKE